MRWNVLQSKGKGENIMKIPNQVIQFAQGEENLAPYRMFVDYFNHFKAQNGGRKHIQAFVVFLLKAMTHATRLTLLKKYKTMLS